MISVQYPRTSAWVMMAPLIAGIVLGIANRSDAILPILRIYILLSGIGFFIYMVREVRRYGRWLRDNYADLEHKELWHSFIVLAAMMLVFGIYSFAIKVPAYLSKQQIMWKSREWMSIFREGSFKICKKCFKISKK